MILDFLHIIVLFLNVNFNIFMHHKLYNLFSLALGKLTLGNDDKRVFFLLHYKLPNVCPYHTPSVLQNMQTKKNGKHTWRARTKSMNLFKWVLLLSTITSHIKYVYTWLNDYLKAFNPSCMAWSIYHEKFMCHLLVKNCIRILSTEL